MYALRVWGCETCRRWYITSSAEDNRGGKRLGRRTIAGESPVPRERPARSHLEYHATRAIAWEAGPPTVQDNLLVVTDSVQYREGTVKSTPVRGVK